VRHLFLVLALFTAAGLAAISAAPAEDLPRIIIELLTWDDGAKEFVILTGSLSGTWQWLPGPRPAAAWHVSFDDVHGWGLPSGRRYRVVTDFERWLPLADRCPQRIVMFRSVFVCEEGSTALHTPLRMQVTITVAAPAGPAREVIDVKVVIGPPREAPAQESGGE
jgi:hypothetical protein